MSTQAERPPRRDSETKGGRPLEPTAMRQARSQQEGTPPLVPTSNRRPSAGSTPTSTASPPPSLTAQAAISSFHRRSFVATTNALALPPQPTMQRAQIGGATSVMTRSSLTPTSGRSCAASPLPSQAAGMYPTSSYVDRSESGGTGVALGGRRRPSVHQNGNGTPPRRPSVTAAPSGAATPTRSPPSFSAAFLHLPSSSSTRASSEPGKFFPAIAGASRSHSSPSLQPQPSNAAVPHFDLDEDSGVFTSPPTPRRSPSQLIKPMPSPVKDSASPRIGESFALRSSSLTTNGTKPAVPKSLAPLGLHSRRLFNNVTAVITDMDPPRSPTTGSMLRPRASIIESTTTLAAPTTIPSPPPPRLRSPQSHHLIPRTSFIEPNPFEAAKLVESLEELRRMPIQAPSAHALMLPSDPLSLLSPRGAIVPPSITAPKPKPPKPSQLSVDFDLHVEDSGSRPRRWKHPNRRRSFSDSEVSDNETEQGDAVEWDLAESETLEDIEVARASGFVAPLTPLIAALDAIPLSPGQTSPRPSPTRRKRRDTGSMAMGAVIGEHLTASGVSEKTEAAPAMASPTSTTIIPLSPTAHVASSIPAHMKLSVVRTSSVGSNLSSSMTSSVGSSIGSSVSVSRQPSVDSPSSTMSSSLSTRTSSVCGGELDSSRASMVSTAHNLLSFGGQFWDSPSARRSSIIVAPSSPGSTFVKFTPAGRAKTYSPAVPAEP